MKKGMCITYEVEGALYVNVTNKCSNKCVFCIRNNADGAYGSDPLWLQREPTVSEIVNDILSRDLTRYREMVFCGYGEPSYRLSDICEAVKKVREIYPDIKVRINTNGQSDLILGFDTEDLYEGVFDAVSISLNSPHREKYQEICQSVFGENAFDAMLLLAKRLKDKVPSVYFSVVDKFISPEDLLECERIASECDIPLRVRAYIGKET